MAQRVIQTSKRLAAERQIHAAIVHFQAGDFECAITLCHAAEGQLPEPNESADLFGRLKRSDAEHPAPDGKKEDFNFFANWMKHVVGPDEIEIVEWLVKLWLYRAIARYHAIYGIGTPEMATLFSWAGKATRGHQTICSKLHANGPCRSHCLSAGF
jgi:hypothetical protein